MDRKSLEDNFRLEQDYWWFAGRRKVIANLIRKFFKEENDSIALDAGCGTGLILNELEEHAIPIGIDRSNIALDFTKKRKHNKILCGDICRLPFKGESFDLITILGVLYNRGVTSDDVAIKESFRVLKKNGIIIIDEAAYNFLQSKHNVSVGGIRRYTRSQLISKVKECGFKVLKASYWNSLMFPVFYLMVKLENHFAGEKQLSKLRRISYPLNAILKRYLYFEAFLMKYISFPFGPSLIIVAKK